MKVNLLKRNHFLIAAVVVLGSLVFRTWYKDTYFGPVQTKATNLIGDWYGMDRDNNYYEILFTKDTLHFYCPQLNLQSEMAYRFHKDTLILNVDDVAQNSIIKRHIPYLSHNVFTMEMEYFDDKNVNSPEYRFIEKTNHHFNRIPDEEFNLSNIKISSSSDTIFERVAHVNSLKYFISSKNREALLRQQFDMLPI